MFTKNQIEEIKKKLNLDALKDTDFDLAQDLTGEEYVVLVQNGKNVKIPLKFAGFDGAITIDPSLFTAEVVSVEVTDEPWAEVELTTEGKFEFSFGLPENTGGSGGSGGNGGNGGNGGGGSDTPDDPNDPNDPPTVKPDEPIYTKTINIFKTNPTKPSTPSGGNYNFETGTFTPPSGWGIKDDIEAPIWVSTRTFYSDTNINSYWSTPYQIQSNIEGAGVDTSSIEFMFKTTEYGIESSKPTIPSNQSNWDPKNDDWTDSPTGISETQQGEWVITRLKKEDGTWGLWEGPSLWAKWGSVGQDGDGVEYLYMVNDTGTQPVYNPTPSNWKTNTDYQSKTKEYIPTNSSNITNWFTDNPTGVSEDNEYEWVWIRKFRYYTDPTTGEVSTTKMWCPFEGPALWAKWGEKGSDGLRVRTFYTETTSSSIEPALEADWTLLQIANNGWSEVMPVFTGSNAIWATECYITPTGEKSGEFTTPPRLVSSASVEVKVPTTYTSNYYTKGVEGYTPNTPAVNTFAPDDYITSTDGTNTYDWIDAPTNGTDTWYQSVATINTVSNKIVKWSPVSIWNGRDGADGKDGQDGADGEAQPGTYYEVRVAIVSEDLLTVPISKYNINPNYGLDTIYWKKPSEASFAVDAGQRMWETRAQFNAGGNSFADSNGWCTPYPITGEKGPQGEQGPTGPRGPAGTSGVPGVSFEERYCSGTSVAPYFTPDLTNINPGDYWTTTVPESDPADDEFVWCIKGRVKYANDTDTVGTLEGEWSKPFRLSGTNGVGGENIPETLVATLTNPTGTVVVDGNNNVINGLPIETELKVYTANDGEATLSGFTFECLDASENLFNITTDATNCKLTVNAYPSTINPDTVRFRLSANIKGTSTPTYYQIFTINRVSTGDSPIVANLYNDNANIPASYEGEILDPDIENTFEIREGIEYTPLDITELYLSNSTGGLLSYTGISLSRNGDKGNFTLNLTNNAFSGSTNVKYVYITGKATTSKGIEVQRTLGFRLNLVKAGEPGESPIWYEIKPVGSHSIVYNRIENRFTPSTLLISVFKNYFDDKGNLKEEKLTINALNSEKLILKYRIDNSQTEYNLNGLSLDINNVVKYNDFEENIEFILYGENDSIKDRETIPLLANGIDGKSYSIEVVDYNDPDTNVHVIHKDYQGIITNLSGNTNAKKAVTCIIKVIDGKNITIIDNANLWNDYAYGFDLTCRVDGEIVENYNPGNPILGVDIKNNVQFVLKWELSADNDILWDSNTVEVVAPGGVTKNGQLIYPAGHYSLEETYQCTATKAPYVLDPTDNRFYIYNSVSPWIGENQPAAYNTPSTHYNNMANSNAPYDTILWIPFDMNEAIYSDVGVLNQALIGSAVFYKDYVFSQKGIGGNSNFEDFDKDHPFESTPSKNWNEWTLVESVLLGGAQQFTIESETVISTSKRLGRYGLTGGISTTATNLGMKINVTGMTANDKLYFINNAGVPYITIQENGNHILSTPSASEYEGPYCLQLVSSDTYNTSEVIITITSVFYPVTCFNFKTGETWLGKNQLIISEDGQISFNHTNAKFNPDGSGSLGNEQIQWNIDGTITIGNFTIKNGGLYYNNGDGSTFQISNSGIHYFFSDDNSYFDISSEGDATFASGRVKFNKDGSGQININQDGKATLKWDADGNITQCNLNDQAIIQDEYEYFATLKPNTTKYLRCTGVDSSFKLMIPRKTYDDSDIKSEEYYGSIVVLNTQAVTIRVYIAEESSAQPTTYVDLKPYGSVRINYFLNDDDDLFAYIEGKHSLYTE